MRRYRAWVVTLEPELDARMIDKERLRKVSLAIAVALVFCAPLCIGSVHPPVIIVQSFLATFALALIVWTSNHKQRLVPYSVVGFGLLGFFCILQVVPLPSWLASVVSPKSFEIWQAMEQTVGVQKGSYPLSVDPPGSALEATRFIGLASMGLVWASLVFIYGARLLRFGAWAVVTSALFAFFVGVLSKILTPDRIFFFYSPTYLPEGKWGFLTTFVNGNHQASFFGLSALCAFGLFFKAGTRLEKVLFMFALLVFVGVILVTGSVAGLVIFSLLILVFLVIRAFAHKGGGVFAFSNLSIVLAMLLTLFALILAFYPKEEGLLTPPPGSHSLETRFTIWEAALHLFKNFWLSGAGGGATGAVLTEANPIPNLIFYHLENQWLETLFEYGAIVGAVCILLVLFNIALIYPGFRGRTLHIAVFAGLCGLCLHNLVDFNLAFNGTGIPFASLLGALVGVAASKGNHKGRRFGVFLSISAQRILGMFAVGVVMFLAFRPLGQTTLEEHEPADPIDSQMRHPAWFLPAFSLAQSLQMQGDSTSSSKWVDFVQQRAPNFVSVKALVVRQLLMEGDFDKAKEAFSRLWLDKDFLSGQLEFIFATPQAQEAIPQFSSLFDAEDEEFWAIAKFLERKERFGIEEQVLRLAFEKNKYHPRVAFALGWLYLRFEMTREAEDVGFLSMAEYPEASQGYHILGLAKMQEKSYWDAYHLFLEGLKFAPYDYSLLSAAATSAISVRELDTAEKLARRALGVCETKAYCLNARILQSYVFEAKGDLKGALRVMEAGETLGMDNVPYLERMALLAIEAKNVPRAIYLLRRVLAIDPLNKRARDMLDKILK